MTNENGLDRIVRLVLGIVGIWVGLMPLGGVSGVTLGLVVALVGLVLFVTGLFGSCLMYRALGFSTKH